MSTSWGEPNAARWVGVRPGHGGSQIVKSGKKANGTEILYTVTAGKTLYLISVESMVSDNVGGLTAVYIRDELDVTWYQCDYRMSVQNNPNWGKQSFFFPPLEVPAGYDICMYSNVAGLNCQASIFGWEE